MIMSLTVGGQEIFALFIMIQSDKSLIKMRSSKMCLDDTTTAQVCVWPSLTVLLTSNGLLCKSKRILAAAVKMWAPHN